MKNVISWDWDWTLYNPHKKSIIQKTFDMFSEQRKRMDVVITTYRSKDDINEIFDYLGDDIEVFCCGDVDKALYLKYNMPYNVITHYDDDASVCLRLFRNTSIIPVWVRPNKFIEDLKRMNHISVNV